MSQFCQITVGVINHLCSNVDSGLVKEPLKLERCLVIASHIKISDVTICPWIIISILVNKSKFGLNSPDGSFEGIQSRFRLQIFLFRIYFFFFFYNHARISLSCFVQMFTHIVQDHFTASRNSFVALLIAVKQLWRTLLWRHNGRDGVSNNQPHDCLLDHSFRRRSKKTSKFRVTGFCA